MSFPRFDPAAFMASIRPTATVATSATLLTPRAEVSQKSQLSQGVAPETAMLLMERASIALCEGGIPEMYAFAFAALQVRCPAGCEVHKW